MPFSISSVSCTIVWLDCIRDCAPSDVCLCVKPWKSWSYIDLIFLGVIRGGVRRSTRSRFIAVPMGPRVFLPLPLRTFCTPCGCIALAWQWGCRLAFFVPLVFGIVAHIASTSSEASIDSGYGTAESRGGIPPQQNSLIVAVSGGREAEVQLLYKEVIRGESKRGLAY
jgi:hypothetical protein